MKKSFKYHFSSIRYHVTCYLLFVTCFGFVSCHKYPEDPFISLRKPENRIHDIYWQFTSYQIHGVEHSHDFDSILKPHTLTDFKLLLYKDRDAFYYSVTDFGFYEKGIWELSTDNKTFWLDSYSNGYSSDKFYEDIFKPAIIDTNHWAVVNWKIEDLYQKTFHISNNGIDIYFKKQ